ncbi:hypothetical protein EM595_p0401 (plasmid) [Duffyella gerundensis]|uniref:Uncharacterized protein n=1 Tax=Duffyella gerundensis TaxID=1619313 RepID=A0A0U5GTN2_9GAMM|nr:hypothetical protein EM595_p0401 [Duffyella gerundensis]
MIQEGENARTDEYSPCGKPLKSISGPSSYASINWVRF